MKNKNIIDQWNALDGLEQLNFCRRCVVKVANREFGLQELLQNGNELDDYANTVYLKLVDERLTPEHIAKVNTNRARDGKPEITLQSMVYKTARALLGSAIRRYCQEAENSSGWLDAAGEWWAGLQGISEDFTESLIMAVDLEAFKNRRDTTDQQILDLVFTGHTEREISKEIGTISNVAVHKRIVKMRAALWNEAVQRGIQGHASASQAERAQLLPARDGSLNP